MSWSEEGTPELSHSGVSTEDALWGDGEEEAVSQEGGSPDTNPAGTLISDFQAPELWARKFVGLAVVCGVLLWWPEETNTSC